MKFIIEKLGINIDTEGQPVVSYIIISIAILILCALIGAGIMIGFSKGTSTINIEHVQK